MGAVAFVCPPRHAKGAIMPIRCDCCAVSDARFGGLCHCCYLERVETAEGKREAKVLETVPVASTVIDTLTNPRKKAAPC